MLDIKQNDQCGCIYRILLFRIYANEHEPTVRVFAHGIWHWLVCTWVETCRPFSLYKLSAGVRAHKRTHAHTDMHSTAGHTANRRVEWFWCGHASMRTHANKYIIIRGAVVHMCPAPIDGWRGWMRKLAVRWARKTITRSFC